MKKQNEQFEKNIAHLVKSTNESQIPSENFTNNLIDEALKKLPEDQDRRQNRSKPMKSKRYLLYAASILVVFGILSVVLMPSLNKVQHRFTALEDSTNTLPMYAIKNQPESDTRVKEEREYANRLRTDNTITNAYKPKSTDLVSSTTEPRPMFVGTPEGKPIAMERVSNKDIFVAKSPSPKGVYDQNTGTLTPMAHGGNTPPNGEDVDAMFFKTYGVNPFVDTEDDHLSTFAIDVDTGSYTVCRRYLQEGNLPPKEAVRVEEFVNYFKYDYPAPREDNFSVFFEAMPWQFGHERKNTQLMRIGLKAMEIPDEYRKPAILTFVIDVSGSMNRENRLGLVKQSLRLLIDKLRPEDKIGIALYGSRGRQVLSHTGLEDKYAILEAIDSLHPEGSTNAEEGIRIGYDMAEQSFVPGYINRVILCSDGVANVGRTGHEEIFKMIKSKADKGVTLSALGFGMGNYNDVLMERLGDKGNGYYAYIDTLDQAKRLFSNLTGALQVVARDVKIQVDFNSDVVRSYRLIGYENRDVADVDFRNDKVDGGEIGAGHSTTALYELKLWPDKAGKIATTYIRYKDPDTFKATEISADFDTQQTAAGFSDISNSFALASVVTEFAEVMRQSYWAKGANLEDTLEKTKQISNKLEDNADVEELLSLIERANQLLKDKATTEPAEIHDEDSPKPAPIRYE